MKLVQFNDWRIGVQENGVTFDVTAYVKDAQQLWPPSRMLRLIEDFDELRPRIERDLREGRVPAAAVERWLPPISQPNKVIGAPVNYKVHLSKYPDAEKYTTRASGFFLKAPSAIVGPNDDILLPGGTVNYEAELAFVMARAARDVAQADAMSYVFGYTGMLDLTRKGPEGRSMRKSFDTFAPMGPCIVTADEIADPHNLNIRIWIDGQLRCDYSTSDMICRIPELIEYTSSIMTLLPGDVYTSGNGGDPDRLNPGETIRFEIEGVGSMSLPVKSR